MMRPKIVEENIDNFNAVAKDAIARFVKLKEAGGADADHIPDLEGELSRFSTESKFLNCFRILILIITVKPIHAFTSLTD